MRLNGPLSAPDGLPHQAGEHDLLSAATFEDIKSAGHTLSGAAVAAASVASDSIRAGITSASASGGRRLSVDATDSVDRRLLSAIDMLGGGGGGGGGVQTEPLALYWQPFWYMYAEFDIDVLRQVPFALPLMWVYVLLANVVLVNMLIAMFADTYTRIKRNAEVEYQYQHYLHIFEYQHVVHHLPPPFNAPMLLWDACRACFRSTEALERLVRMDFGAFPEREYLELYGAAPLLHGAGSSGSSTLSRKCVLGSDCSDSL